MGRQGAENQEQVVPFLCNFKPGITENDPENSVFKYKAR